MTVKLGILYPGRSSKWEALLPDSTVVDAINNGFLDPYAGVSTAGGQVCTHTYIHIHTNIHTYKYTYIYLHIYECMCIHIHAYTYTCIYTYMYLYQNSSQANYLANCQGWNLLNWRDNSTNSSNSSVSDRW
jgi:hypothetical protein